MKFSRRPREKLEIMMIPLIDVVLLLLIFFMMTTTFNHQSALKIQLPEAQGAEASPEAQKINLTIDASGAYALDGEKLADGQAESLKNALLAKAGNTRQVPFIISADAKTPHQAVITALDVAGQIGLTHITFAAMRKAGN
jgi:biopolymer transport protein ExbD